MRIRAGIAPAQIPDQAVNLLTIYTRIMPVGTLHLATGLKAAAAAEIDGTEKAALTRQTQGAPKAAQGGKVKTCYTVVQLFHIPARSRRHRKSGVLPRIVVNTRAVQAGRLTQKGAELSGKSRTAHGGLRCKAVQRCVRNASDAARIHFGFNQAGFQRGKTASQHGHGDRLGAAQCGEDALYFRIKCLIKHVYA